MTIKLLQINLHHCIAACGVLQQYVIGKDIDIILIQEPYLVKNRIRGLDMPGYSIIASPMRPRTCILFKNKLKIFPLWDYCFRDLTTVKLALSEGKRREEITVASVYLPYEEDIPTAALKRLAEGMEEKPLVASLDANAHHSLWGSSEVSLY